MTRLPAGWTLEPLPPDHDVVRAPNGDAVTLDYHERCLRIGESRTSRALAGGEYRGRAWRGALLADAIVHLGGAA